MNPAVTTLKDCYICEQPGADTRDHVIPKNLFADRPSNLITLPAHQGCNASLSKDEEFLRAFVLSSAYEHPEAKELWKQRVMSRMTEGFRRGLVSRIKVAEVKTTSGKSIGRTEILVAEKSRIDRVLHKMVRGLFHYHLGSLIGEVSWESFQGRVSALEEIANVSAISTLGHSLTYGYAVNNDDFREGIWWFLLFERVLFVVITSRDTPTDLQSGEEG